METVEREKKEGVKPDLGWTGVADEIHRETLGSSKLYQRIYARSSGGVTASNAPFHVNCDKAKVFYIMAFKQQEDF